MFIYSLSMIFDSKKETKTKLFCATRTENGKTAQKGFKLYIYTRIYALSHCKAVDMAV